jgi:hypothetical protein
MGRRVKCSPGQPVDGPLGPAMDMRNETDQGGPNAWRMKEPGEGPKRSRVRARFHRTAPRMGVATFGTGLVVLLGLLPLTSATFTFNYGSLGYTSGCTGQSPGDTVHSAVGTYRYNITPPAYNPVTGYYYFLEHSWQWARTPTGASNVSEGDEFDVGPNPGYGPGAPVGCYQPAKSLSALNASYQWNLEYSVDVSGNCSGTSTASATATVMLVANLHIGTTSPYYVFTTMPGLMLSHHSVTCAGYTSGIVNTGTTSVTTPSFSVTAGHDYDFYTSVYVAIATSAGDGSTAFAGVTIYSAQLNQVTCNSCT